MHGVMGGRLAVLGDGFFMPVNPVFLNLAGGDFREAQMTEERDQVVSRSLVQAPDVVLAALALRDDVVFPEVLVRIFAEGPLGFDFSGAEFATELKIPILGDFLGFGETVFFRAPAAIATSEICGALPATAVRSSIDVNFAAENRVLFRHGRMSSHPGQKTEMCKQCVSYTEGGIMSISYCFYYVYCDQRIAVIRF